MYRYDSLNRISDELDRTAVISDQFKRWLMSWAQAVASEAYRAGQEDERERHVNVDHWRIVPVLPSTPDCFKRKFPTFQQAEHIRTAMSGGAAYTSKAFSRAGKIIADASVS